MPQRLQSGAPIPQQEKCQPSKFVSLSFCFPLRPASFKYNPSFQEGIQSRQVILVRWNIRFSRLYSVSEEKRRHMLIFSRVFLRSVLFCHRRKPLILQGAVLSGKTLSYPANRSAFFGEKDKGMLLPSGKQEGDSGCQRPFRMACLLQLNFKRKLLFIVYKQARKGLFSVGSCRF